MLGSILILVTGGIPAILTVNQLWKTIRGKIVLLLVKASDWKLISSF